MKQSFIFGEKPHLVDLAVDWVTYSWPSGKGTHPFMSDVVAHYDRSVLRGAAGEARQSQNQGGYVGTRYGAAWLGERRGDWLLRCSGAAARHMGPLLWGSGGRCTRIDLQATVQLMGDVDAAVYRSVCSMIKGREAKMGRPYNVQLIKTYGNGDSGLGGGRTSPLYVRCYNKEAQSGGTEEYRGCLRLEAECKGEIAEHVFDELVGQAWHGEVVGELLHSALGHRGIDDLGTAFDLRQSIWHFPHVPTSVDRKLQWLENMVRGTVKQLMVDGYTEAVYTALGLENDGVNE